MAQASLRFAKIVATPTDTAWSQAYNEGGVFTVLALTKTEDIEPESLNTIGKEILNIFRSEFFTLEDKSLSSLKSVVHKSFEHCPPSILVSFVVAFNKDDLLYLLVVGGGKVLMKRGGKTGVLVDKTVTTPERHVAAASGVLQSDDIILLETQEFSEKITASTLEEALSLDLPNDIAEALNPKVHDSEQGASAALILSYQGVPKEQIEEEIDEEVEDNSVVTPEPIQEKAMDEPAPDEPLPVNGETQNPEEIDDDLVEETPQKKKFSLSTLPRPNKALLLIGIAAVLLIILVGSILTTKHNQENAKTHALFESLYNDAKNEYDTGVGLLTLNKSLARDNFLSAQETLKKANGKFKEGTDEKKKIDELIGQVGKELAGTSNIHSVQADKADDASSPALAAKRDSSTSIAVASEDNTVYLLTSKGVVSDGKTTIPSDGWTKPVSIGAYGGNIYILDSEEGVFKYVKNGSSYAKSDYFKSAVPDLTKAVSLGIDGSIYILTSDGKVAKYTKGVADSFKVTGMTTPFSSPTRLYTSSDLTDLYILEPKSGRIVILDKNGSFSKEISSSVLSDATDFEIDQKGETAYVLSKDTLYSMSLK